MSSAVVSPSRCVLDAVGRHRALPALTPPFPTMPCLHRADLGMRSTRHGWAGGACPERVVPTSGHRDDRRGICGDGDNQRTLMLHRTKITLDAAESHP